MASSFHYFAVANLVLFFGLASSQLGPQGEYCNPNSSIPPGSPVSANINNVLAAMNKSSQLRNGFSALLSGVGADTVFGLANCRGDQNIQQYCIPCIRDAVTQIQRRCPGTSDAQVWYNDCIVRYSQENFFGTFDASRNAKIRYHVDFEDPESAFSALGTLFDAIISGVAGNANNGMVKDQTALPGGPTIYGGALCTADLRPDVCAQCLRAAVGLFNSFCKPSQGCKVFLSSCFARYEIYPFRASLDAGFSNTLPSQAIERLTRYEFEQAKTS